VGKLEKTPIARLQSLLHEYLTTTIRGITKRLDYLFLKNQFIIKDLNKLAQEEISIEDR